MTNEKEFEFKDGDRVMIEGVLEPFNSNDYPFILRTKGGSITVTKYGNFMIGDRTPILKLIECPKPKLTFQFIRENLVPMKHLFKTHSGEKVLYLGFTRNDKLVTDTSFASPFEILTWDEMYIENWTYEEYKE
jgi:hypothetical protein